MPTTLLAATCAHDRRESPAAEGLQAPPRDKLVTEKKWGMFSRRGADPADFSASTDTSAIPLFSNTGTPFLGRLGDAYRPFGKLGITVQIFVQVIANYAGFQTAHRSRA